MVPVLRSGWSAGRLRGCPTAPGGTASIGDVRRLLIEPPGSVDDAEVVRTKLIGRLFQSRKIAIVECAGDADAILSLSAATQVVTTPVPGEPEIAFTDYRASVSVHLLGASKRPLLEFNVQRENSRKWTSTSKAAGQAAKEIIRAIETDRGR